MKTRRNVIASSRTCRHNTHCGLVRTASLSPSSADRPADRLNDLVAADRPPAARLRCKVRGRALARSSDTASTDQRHPDRASSKVNSPIRCSVRTAAQAQVCCPRPCTIQRIALHRIASSAGGTNCAPPPGRVGQCRRPACRHAGCTSAGHIWSGHQC